MHRVETADLSESFARCYQAAGRHIEAAARKSSLEPMWIKARLEPPFLEHLSFRLGNQLFFIQLEDFDGAEAFPGTSRGLRAIADGCKGHACVMPMRRLGGVWVPAFPGWGLLDASDRQLLSPTSVLTEAAIEMTDWEVHDMAVGVVRKALEDEGREIMSSQGNPEVDPSIWFVGDNGPEFVVVRAVRYPLGQAQRPANWGEIARNCAGLSSLGNFASVSIANADDPFDPSGLGAMPLWRGGPMYVKYEGLNQLQ